MKLVLFDIDGTILLSDGAGRRSMERALTSIFGSSGDAQYRYDGKTDRQIVRELMRHEGHGDAHIDEHMHVLLDTYLTGLRSELETDEHRVVLLPGVMPLLDALEQRADVVLGLLTGNLVEGAEVKLRAAGIDPARFRVGAYGSDRESRPDLPAVAQQRAAAMLGDMMPGERVVVIGDTPADIQCGRGIGARAIGVATGRYTVEELRAHSPAAVFQNLTDTGAVIRAIEQC